MSETPANQKDNQSLLIGDLMKHLARWAALEMDERTGNPSLSEGLNLLAACLKPHKSLPIHNLAVYSLHVSDSRVQDVPKPRVNLPENLESLDWDQVNAILDNEDIQKKQLVELGKRRLGISGSKLSRLKRADAIESIRAVLDHERSLEAIATQARMTGERQHVW